jgi:Transmembrane domain of unknown function (DUF3566)
VEQRTDETARLSRVAAEDEGPPARESRQADTTSAAHDESGEANGHSGQAGWDPAGYSAGGSRTGAPDYPAPAADDGYSSSVTESSYPATESGPAFPADDAYPGPGVDDGYGPPGSERDYPAPSVPSREFPAPSVQSNDYGARPAETVYSGATTQQDYAAAPYPSQVAPPAPQSQPEPEQPSTAAQWRAAAASRIPKPQMVAKRPRTSRGSDKSGAQSRQAHLMVARLEPWSVMKFSFMISLVCFVILFVAVTILYGTLAGLGVFDAIQKALSNVTSGQGTAGVNASHWFSASTILGYTALLGALDVVLITAFATVGSVVYNLTAHLVGGVEVTLRETD